ncbi:hypothetical protein [Streptosporangium sp. V21-05]|uniref:hypothetical protein n=1 Tax=Streptosporangium sp. V21-05 TaxID=3446115 RepID=UPI003F52E1B2
MSQPDRTLQVLVDTVDDIKTGISITLMVNGTLITGELISAEEFAGNVAQQINRAHNFTSPDTKGFDIIFEHMGQDATARREKAQADLLANDDSLDPEPAEFLHLRNAHPITGSTVPGGDGAWWRIRLADVGGWSCSQMSTQR